MELPDSIYKQALDNALDMIMITKANFDDVGNSPIVYINKAFCQTMEYTQEEIIGQSPRIFQGEKTAMEARDKIRNALNNLQPVQTEILNYTKTGRECWLELSIVPLVNEHQEVTHYLSIERDLSEKKAIEQKLYRDATIDSLSQLSNRQHFMTLSEQELHKSRRYKTKSCVLMMDIDHFKRVNDQYGHQIGDEVIRDTGQIIQSSSRDADICGRIGGEEFAAFLPETSTEEAQNVAERIRKSMEEHSWSHYGIQGNITLSIGLSEFRADDTFEILIKRADDALYQAKSSGRNRTVTNNP
ncbi:diguanylate cyclase [Pleionea sp. CnH1-48]|uniref:diguanylate cyclase n=1 Tax=Pleionea sp. CnH1-48 TaxID=2954494 RepID=UPI002096E329|nr:diguanylate cyclase [Pleionea sp. CnH1-48]MCO7225094.1 diguanylate cyclase [Pleionea sp. CnH1-48]